MMITRQDIEAFNNRELDELFNVKLTENGDNAHISTGNRLFDLFFMTEYYEKHLKKAAIGYSDVEKILAMFIRDPRFGLGKRELGRVLMAKSGVSAANVVKCGRFDDLWKVNADIPEWIDFLLKEVKAGNALAKKWMPHYAGKNKKTGKVAKTTLFAAKMRRILGLNNQQYNKLVKVDTVESKLSAHRNEEIDFEKLPSLALLKYWARFATKQKGGKHDFSKRFSEYLDKVKAGKKKMHLSTATVYDIYRNMDKIDPDIAFDQIKKVSGSWVPVVDTSGSMLDDNDSMGKALAIGHYLGKTSTYCPDQVVSFSSCPRLIDLGECPVGDGSSQYRNEINAMHTGDYTNTDFGAVMRLFDGLKTDFPDFIVVLSDMEFDIGSSNESKKLLAKWADEGVRTKLVWWNLNSRSKTSPQSVRTDGNGNLFLSGYNPSLLGFLEAGFSMSEFLSAVLTSYSELIGC